MSAWPWMKDCNVALVAEPIPPVNDEDDRPVIRELIDQHQNSIRKMKGQLQSDPLYSPDKHDDFWILRFLLSHEQEIEPSVKAARYTLQYRHEHKLDEMDRRPFPPTDHDYQHSDAVRRFLEGCQHGSMCQYLPDPRRSVVSLTEPAGVDMDSIVAKIDESDWLIFFVHLTEWMHQWLDYVSRTTGRLTKSIRITNLEGFSVWKRNLSYSWRLKKTFGILEDCYPQLLGKVFFCHPPISYEWPWRIARWLGIVPERVMKKIDFISPTQNEEDKLKLLKFIDCDKLPERLGGTYTPWPIELQYPDHLVPNQE